LNRHQNTTERIVLERGRAEVRRMRDVLPLRPAPHVPRAHCVDCGVVVVLMDGGACPCGSRSVVPMGARREA